MFLLNTPHAWVNPLGEQAPGLILWESRQYLFHLGTCMQLYKTIDIAIDVDIAIAVYRYIYIAINIAIDIDSYSYTGSYIDKYG